MTRRSFEGHTCAHPQQPTVIDLTLESDDDMVSDITLDTYDVDLDIEIIDLTTDSIVIDLTSDTDTDTDD